MILSEENTFIYTFFYICSHFGEVKPFFVPKHQQLAAGLDDAQDAGRFISFKMRSIRNWCFVILFWFTQSSPEIFTLLLMLKRNKFSFLHSIYVYQCACACADAYVTIQSYLNFTVCCMPLIARCSLFLRINSEFHHTKYSIFCTFPIAHPLPLLMPPLILSLFPPVNVRTACNCVNICLFVAAVV